MSEGATLASLEAALKIDYKGPITNRLNNSTVYFRQLEKTSDYIQVSGQGLKAVFPIVTGENESPGWRAENAPLPPAGQVSSLQLESALKYLYASIRITGQTLKASAKSATRFAEVVQMEIDSVTKAMRSEVGIQLHSPAAGWLCQTNGAGAGSDATVNVDNPGTIWLRRRAKIETRAYSVSNGVGTISDAVADSDISEGLTASTAHAVNTIAKDKKSFELMDYNGDEITTEKWADDRYVFRYGTPITGTSPCSMLGLFDIMDDYTIQSSSSWFDLQNCLVTIQGKSRSTYANSLNALVSHNDGTLRPLTEDVLQEGLDLALEETGDEEHTGQMLLMDYNMRRKFMRMLRSDRNFSPNYLELRGGHKVLAYHAGNAQIPIVGDRFCIPNTIMIPNVNYINIHRAGDFDWLDKMGSMWEKASDASGRYDAYLADMYYYCEQGCKSFRDQVAIRDIAT
mgnify:CR=1 FL=1